MKLAGQCGKLKCCLNYELDSYLDALKDFPSNHEKLSVQNGTAYLIKTDIFRRKLFYQLPGDGGKIIPLSPERVKEIQESLKTGLLMNPDALKELVEEEEVVVKDPDFENVVGQDSLTRFDKKKRKKKSRKGNNRTENKLEVGTINTPIPNVQPAGARPNRPRPNPQAAQNTQNRPQRSGNPPEASQRRERPDQQKKTQHPRPQGNQERRPRPPRNPGGSEQKSPE
jgi:hypothetical protein